MRSFRMTGKRFLAAAALALAVPAALAADNPLARATPGAASGAPIQGLWNGADLERRANCTYAQNDGSRGTYAQFDVSSDGVQHVLGIDQAGITGLDCGYFGKYSGSGPTFAWSGTYSCTDGKRGTFTSRGIQVSGNALTIHLDVQLDTTETCTVEKVIAAGRLYP